MSAPIEIPPFLIRQAPAASRSPEETARNLQIWCHGVEQEVRKCERLFHLFNARFAELSGTVAAAPAVAAAAVREREESAPPVIVILPRFDRLLLLNPTDGLYYEVIIQTPPDGGAPAAVVTDAPGIP